MNKTVQLSATGAPDVLELVDGAPAAAPGPGEIRVRNRAVGVNFLDILIRRGELPAELMPDLPHVPGVEGAGEVEAVGAGVESVRPGDRIAWLGPLGAGGYATRSVVPAAGVTALPDGLAFETAAALPANAVTAWHMLTDLGHAEAGQTVLVHAAGGGVGTMAVQIARRLGLTVVALAGADKLDGIRALGADVVLDRRSGDLPERIRAATGGRGVDLSLNPVAGPTLAADLGLLAPFGTAILFGFLAGPPAGSFAEDLVPHFNRSIGIRTCGIYTLLQERPAVFNAALAAAVDLAGMGVLQPQIDTVMPLRDAGDAHRRLEAGTVAGKLVLTIP